MRLFAYVLVGMILSCGTHAQALRDVAPFDRFIATYETTRHAPKEDVARCVRLMRGMAARDVSLRLLSPDARARIESELRTVHCLDEYSTLLKDVRAAGASLIDTIAGERVRLELIGEYLFIRIPKFRNTAEQLEKELIRIGLNARLRVKKVVVDLRSNPGGGVDELRRVTDRLFSPKSQLVFLKHVGPETPEKGTHRTTMLGDFAGLDVVFLINGGSASASEWMVAVVCFEWQPEKCSIVGTTSFGKATLQCKREIGEFSLWLTCGEWFIHAKFYPDGPGTKVHKVGIVPTHAIPLEACGFAYGCVLSVLKEGGL